jgi:hypothetical protein
MDKSGIQSAVEAGNIEWQRHPLERMFERGISREQVKQTILTGSIIEEYSDDTPYPSALFFGWFEGKPMHVVAAYDAKSVRLYVITAYVPDLEHFEPDYKTRR